MTERPARAQASQQLPSSRKWLVLLAIGVGTFMSALDGSVVNTVLPVITRSFAVEVAAIEWVIVIYLLVISGLLLSFGRLGDLYGHKSVYVSGFGVFVASSALCGLAPSAGALIAGRGLQALGSAMLLANGPAILTKSFPAQQRGRALGLQATMTYLGLTVGPSFGGWLAQQLGWRSVFYINLPIGLLAMALSLRFIHHDRPDATSERFDVAGALAFVAGLVALLLALNQGHAWGWTAPLTLGLLVVAGLLLTVFVLIERRVPCPMLDLSLFRRRVFSAAVGSALLNYVAIYSITFLLPFYLIQGRGLNPAQAGLLLTAQPLVMAVAAPLSGVLSDRIGSRLLATLGMLVLGVGLYLLSRLGPQSPLAMVTVGLMVAGLGTGVFISPNSSALMGTAPRHRQGVAASVLALARNVGMVLGVGLAGAIFTSVQSGREVSEAIYSATELGFAVAAVVAVVAAAIAAVRGRT